ncbi:MAG: hypothetical protein HC913_18710 [Microscillaceae bacterium]|nr:hypothetical protein [Microscillaceae bacterium]
MTRPKVFGIGLQRSGTTSLHLALQQLGYRSRHFVPELLQGLAQNPVLEKYEAFSDNPVPLFFRELDALYPGSKFILTVRPIEAWLASCAWMFREKRRAWGFDTRADVREIHARWYGQHHFDEMVFRQVYIQHHQEVALHFAHRTQDLLTLHLEEGKGHWEELVDFLGIEACPRKPFPHHLDRGPWYRLWRSWRGA